MKVIPSLGAQVRARGGQPYKILFDTASELANSFAFAPLLFNQRRQFQIVLDKDVSLYINQIACSLNDISARVDPTIFSPSGPEGLFFNVWDSRNLTKWFIPDSQPLNTGANSAAARSAYRPAPFHVPAHLDLIVEFFSTHTGGTNTDFRMVFTGVLGQVDGAIRQ